MHAPNVCIASSVVLQVIDFQQERDMFVTFLTYSQIRLPRIQVSERSVDHCLECQTSRRQLKNGVSLKSSMQDRTPGSRLNSSDQTDAERDPMVKRSPIRVHT